MLIYFNSAEVGLQNKASESCDLIDDNKEKHFLKKFLKSVGENRGTSASRLELSINNILKNECASYISGRDISSTKIAEIKGSKSEVDFIYKNKQNLKRSSSNTGGNCYFKVLFLLINNNNNNFSIVELYN